MKITLGSIKYERLIVPHSYSLNSRSEYYFAHVDNYIYYCSVVTHGHITPILKVTLDSNKYESLIVLQ